MQQIRFRATYSFVLATALSVLILSTVWARQASTQEPDGQRAPLLIEGVAIDSAVMVAMTHTSQFDPPSPDPSGIAYLGASGTLLIADSEVNEIPALFTGANLFQTTLSGDLLRTMSTLPASDEPTGLAFNAANGHLFVSDDTGTRGFYEIDPGADGAYGTADDGVTFVSSEPFGAMDPEGLAFDSHNGRLILADGADGPGTESIYIIAPGDNGVFDGVAPQGDDVVTRFDALALGLRDPEGVAFNEDNGHLYVLSGQDQMIAEMSLDGALLRMIDLATIGGENLAGLTYGPASADPAFRSVYIVARGVDNSIDPDENDGVLYEVQFPLNIDNLPPYADAGPDQTVRVDEEATLEGVAGDDGMPDPPGMLTIMWSQMEGPGSTIIADANALRTTVSFSAPGSYLLRLTADDDERSAWDEVTITVLPADAVYLPAFAHLTREND